MIAHDSPVSLVPARPGAAPSSPAPATEPRAGRPRRLRSAAGWILVALLAAAGGVVAFVPSVNARARATWDRYAKSEGRGTKPPTAPDAPAPPFRGVLSLTAEQFKALDVSLDPVLAQTEPLHLVVNGRTDYDPNTQNKIRPKFKSRIDKVYVEYGETVKQGDPLVDLFSADLAMAKGDYETKLAQWQYDRGELDRFFKLQPSGAASAKEVKGAENAEKKSSTESKIAKDKLMVFGLSDAEIAGVPKEEGVQKAKMTLRAPTSGVVISRNVVQDNIYDDNDVLLTIAKLDHFWVYGYVYPSDASRVNLGQTWVVECANVGQVHRRKIDSITSEIDKDTKTLVIRTRIDNLEGKIKADMMVSGYLEIPAPTGQARTVVPRLAMVSTDGGDYVFVQRLGEAGASVNAEDDPRRFERRRIRVIHEGAKGVIVAAGDPPNEGLAPGERVVTRGALILAQMYDDATTAESGSPR